MDIGLVKDRRPLEHRVGLTPGGVRFMTEHGHRVYIQDGAGIEAGFGNRAYENVGATVVYSEEDVLLRSELVIRVSPPPPTEFDRFQERVPEPLWPVLKKAASFDPRRRYPDAVAFAVLLMNMAAPTIDYYTQPRVFGQREAADE